MAMVNLGNISAVTTQMLGNELGGVVASGVSTLLHSGGKESLADALSQLEKFFGPQGPGRAAGGAISSGPLAFSAVPGFGGDAGLTNPFGATQGLQPKMQGLVEGLSQTLDDMLQKMGSLGSAQRGLAQPGAGATTGDMAKQFELVMDQAMKLHLSGNAGDGLKAQALFQKALGMLSGGASASSAGGPAASGFAGGASAITGGAGFGAPTGATGFGAGAGGFTSTGGTTPAGGGVSPAGGGLDAMMAQAESLLRSDSMEAQLAGQRMMQKALRMFELISKLIEKQSEMASKAIAAIK